MDQSSRPRTLSDDNAKIMRHTTTHKRLKQTPKSTRQPWLDPTLHTTLIKPPKRSPPSPPLCLHLSSRYTCLPALVSLPQRSKIPRIFRNKKNHVCFICIGILCSLLDCLQQPRWMCKSLSFSSLSSCLSASHAHQRLQLALHVRCNPKHALLRFPAAAKYLYIIISLLENRWTDLASLRSCFKILSYHYLTTGGST